LGRQKAGVRRDTPELIHEHDDLSGALARDVAAERGGHRVRLRREEPFESRRRRRNLQWRDRTKSLKRREEPQQRDRR
jgi:hypothetical protein